MEESETDVSEATKIASQILTEMGGTLGSSSDTVGKRPKRPSRGRLCAAFGCRNYEYNVVNGLRVQTKNKFFQFPKDIEEVKLWCQLIRRQYGKDGFTPGASSVVCHKHFELSALYRAPGSSRVKRKPGALPVLHEWNDFTNILSQPHAEALLKQQLNERDNFMEVSGQVPLRKISGKQTAAIPSNAATSTQSVADKSNAVMLTCDEPTLIGLVKVLTDRVNSLREENKCLKEENSHLKKQNEALTTKMRNEEFLTKIRCNGNAI